MRSPYLFFGWPSAVGLWTGHFIFEGGGGGGKKGLVEFFLPDFFYFLFSIFEQLSLIGL